MPPLLRTISLASLLALAPLMPFSAAQAAENIVYSGAGSDDQLSLEQLLEKAQHDRVSMSNLGSRYYHGKGVAVDYAKALYWYQKAYKAALKWYLTTWKMSHLDDSRIGRDMAGAAASNIGRLYEHGRGVKQDLNKAYDWY